MHAPSIPYNLFHILLLKVGELIKGDVLLTVTFIPFLLTKTGSDFDMNCYKTG